MTVQDSAKQLADSFAHILGETQRSADTIRAAPKHMVVWLFVDHLGRWHRMAPHLSRAQALGARSEEFLDIIEEAEQVLFDGREPWIFARRRKRFRESVLDVLEKHGGVLHGAMMKARALADGGAE